MTIEHGSQRNQRHAHINFKVMYPTTPADIHLLSNFIRSVVLTGDRSAPSEYKICLNVINGDTESGKRGSFRFQ
jgi:hypothetical protein